ncbi:ParM/StbA family protein [Clostridium sardiniense]|uniref:ParM/StbA family protein n=1 Tax=Clostridium sardiniense TaxID=29369 RepID=UPI0019573D70|nr:ParM/StbA family protein [Clostridium sardiniense]MBM7835628.1 plasmid segregation protein ParM [Clostridium sardiniense]
MVTGIDLGNANVKTSRGIIFESKIKSGITKMNEKDIKVIYEGVEYTVGSYDGALNISKRKYFKNAYKINLLTAIAKSCKANNITTNIVVGVPVESFNDKKLTEEIKSHIEDFGLQKIIVNDVENLINIENVEVFCESAIVFSDRERFKNKKTLVIDFGGGTIDISFWDGLNLTKARTYKEGMITLYENIIKQVNNKYSTNLNSNISVDMIDKKTFKINQEDKEISFINPIVETYVDGLTSYINQYFDVESADSIQLIGGGAIQLEDRIKTEYEKAELYPNAEFANANNYEKVGELIWI